MSSDAVKTVRCNNCGEWFDARAGACYLCGEERPEYNHALKVAVETERMNSALNTQLSAARMEQRADQMVRSGALNGNAGGQRIYPGADNVAKSIREKLTRDGMFS